MLAVIFIEIGSIVVCLILFTAFEFGAYLKVSNVNEEDSDLSGSIGSENEKDSIFRKSAHSKIDVK